MVSIVTGDILELSLLAKWQGTDDHVNVFHYRAEEVPLVDPMGDHPDLIYSEFYTEVIAKIRPLVTSDITFRLVRLKMLTGADAGFVLDLPVPPANQAGSGGSDSMPSFVAYNFKYVRPNGNSRHGFKRFGGVPKNYLTDGVLTDSTGLTQVATLAAALNLDIEINNGANDCGTLVPVIQKRESGGVVLPTPLYARPATVVYNKIGSQLTRYVGRGS